MLRTLPALFALTCACAVRAQTAQNVTLPHVGAPPGNASQVLDPRLASFSIEFSYLTAFGGNKTNPNLLTKELMQRLVERTGVGPVRLLRFDSFEIDMRGIMVGYQAGWDYDVCTYLHVVRVPLLKGALVLQ